MEEVIIAFYYGWNLNKSQQYKSLLAVLTITSILNIHISTSGASRDPHVQPMRMSPVMLSQNPLGTCKISEIGLLQKVSQIPYTRRYTSN
jgi:hypothetical protein